MQGNVVELKVAEMVVGALNLRFVDRVTGEAREEAGAAAVPRGRLAGLLRPFKRPTQPEVVLRQLTTRPGQVPCRAAAAHPGPDSRHGSRP